jgi:hypothetical protein
MLDNICQYEYVTATIYVDEQVLIVSLFGEIAEEFKYLTHRRWFISMLCYLSIYLNKFEIRPK